ncbi:4'-phosphopantetheinyl transferase NpgA [Histoplasma capsulatum G186AR]|uniref:holo-[acyl-carrier-protein] synthase n=1 Tax=Ajellomyces capsulatus (strain G186AR / H82 / ATCC MYA-2454 / RMSCC 2432) TaxID=447093 RepID=C0NM31_AJECG|nr:4'-phosphopantetheinyl transferase NpgA [Histoplasma capsulatum G186AR]EEH07682.1 4'-phosphopantetheinyl transferase NpgA [Histoplasma capsulatum G186AR]
MASLPFPSSSPPTLTRWYIDTRPLTATTQSLPLLSTLQESDQTTIKAFYNLSDRHMSLASYLLKYLFIHRTCRVPWNQIIISRTPAPHKRPCYIPPHPPQPSPPADGNQNQNPLIPVPNIEFNVSHQASLISLAGCISPSPRSLDETPSPQPLYTPSANNNHNDNNNHVPSPPQIGIDITCTDDPSRRHRAPPRTEAELHDFIDIFAEVFSANELAAMKAYPRSSSGGGTANLQESITHRIRLFYTYWALKEAYIKMTGEALLAPWLRDLEFANVVVPAPPLSHLSPYPSTSTSSSSLWGVPETGVRAMLYGREVPEVRLEVVAFGNDYIFATAGREGGFGNSMGPHEEGARWDEFRLVDIERDVEPFLTPHRQSARLARDRPSSPPDAPPARDPAPVEEVASDDAVGVERDDDNMDALDNDEDAGEAVGEDVGSGGSVREDDEMVDAPALSPAAASPAPTDSTSLGPANPPPPSSPAGSSPSPALREALRVFILHAPLLLPLSPTKRDFIRKCCTTQPDSPVICPSRLLPIG